MRLNVFLVSSEVKHNRPWAEKHQISICAIEHSSEVANIRAKFYIACVQMHILYVCAAGGTG